MGNSDFQHLPGLLDEGEDVLFLFCTEHGDAGVEIVGDSFEEGRGGKVAADMPDAAKLGVFAELGLDGVLRSTLDADEDLLLEDIDLLVEREGLVGMCYLVEYPGASEGGATYHDSIDAIALEGLLSLFGRGDVAVADDGNGHAGIGFDESDVRPVRFARVHLCSCAAVDGQSLDAAVLQAFGQINNKRRSVGQEEVLLVPSQARLDRDGCVGNSIHNGARDVEDAGNVLQHASSGTFACDLLDRTAEVVFY